ncbi:hypothetical protein AAVH_26344 [Aphelenchoides avenae]|nr:hypothetical protein AAVH_26344 [Aphelenchus avenae]
MTVLYKAHPKDRLTPEERERFDPHDFEAYYGYIRQQPAYLSKAHHNRPYYVPAYKDQSAASEQKMTTLYEKWHKLYKQNHIFPSQVNTEKDGD